MFQDMESNIRKRKFRNPKNLCTNYSKVPPKDGPKSKNFPHPWAHPPRGDFGPIFWREDFTVGSFHIRERIFFQRKILYTRFFLIIGEQNFFQGKILCTRFFYIFGQRNFFPGKVLCTSFFLFLGNGIFPRKSFVYQVFFSFLGKGIFFQGKILCTRFFPKKKSGIFLLAH